MNLKKWNKQFYIQLSNEKRQNSELKPCTAFRSGHLTTCNTQYPNKKLPNIGQFYFLYLFILIPTHTIPPHGACAERSYIILKT